MSTFPRLDKPAFYLILEKLLRTASKLTIIDHVLAHRFQTQSLHVLHVWRVLYCLFHYINAQPCCFFRGVGER